jgi:hypothetical protein
VIGFTKAGILMSAPRPDRPNHGKPTKRKWPHWPRGAIIIAAVATVALLGWATLRRRAPSPGDSTVSVAKYTSSPAFERLSEAERRPYLDALEKRKPQLMAAHQDGSLTDQEYETALKNAWMGHLEKEIDDFFDASSDARRQHVLDKFIDRREAAHSNAVAGSAGHAQLLRNRVQSWPPEILDRWTQFRKAVQDRRKARGLALDPRMEIGER